MMRPFAVTSLGVESMEVSRLTSIGLEDMRSGCEWG
jgi:hypothetical protein